MLQPIQIRLAQNACELQQVFELRFKVYVSELKKTSPYADLDRQFYTDPIDNHGGVVIVAVHHQQVIGTLRLTYRRKIIFLPEDEAIFSSLIAINRCTVALANSGAIDLDFRGLKLYQRLWDFLYGECERANISLLLGVIDANDNKLNAFHRRQGWSEYRRYNDGETES